MECTYCIACRVSPEINISRNHKFDPAGTGDKIWHDLKENGKLTDKGIDEHLKSIMNQHRKLSIFKCML